MEIRPQATWGRIFLWSLLGEEGRFHSSIYLVNTT